MSLMLIIDQVAFDSFPDFLVFGQLVLRCKLIICRDSLLFLQLRPHNYFEIFATAVVWTALILLPIVGPFAIEDDRGSFWSNSGVWCWIGDDYKEIRLAYLYVSS